MSTILPLDLVSLMSMGLLQDATQGYPDTAKESEMTTKSPNRSLEHRTGMLRDEISTLRTFIALQKNVFRTLDSYRISSITPVYAARKTDVSMASRPDMFAYSRPRIWTIYPEREHIVHHGPGDAPRHETEPPYRRQGAASNTNPYTQMADYDFESSLDEHANFKIRATDPGGFRSVFLQECLQHLDRREREFDQMQGQASYLEIENRHRIDTTKDRQEQAIYAFTIVTIVFLPLSAVSSIFGMNTKDVRDMEWSQSIYWAVAIPVTALVIFLGLLMTGELEKVARWTTGVADGTSATTSDNLVRLTGRCLATVLWCVYALGASTSPMLTQQDYGWQKTDTIARGN
ncbi:Mg2+ and Co2+ transporter CorA [Geosmithia morbida]|uniref:Mg2+ and Co2+ transporter CorA n=1 Tax=Geosmithia morbida TaxID=1094350 RepID=A0A9P4Z127_9HYPO|nr:Mg2+ and Co2+ transporter CorA [Geosmithia morbida]KAF4125467.1 Mg2+ and Co2+ transporter CorA [Geosmithia morbida]